MNNLFGTSGVRGLINERITSRLAIELSKSLAKWLDNSGKVLIGRDTRVSGKMLENALVSGFLSSGLEVEKLGIVPTPVVGFSTKISEAKAGVMITASHNPPEYNGIKFFKSNGMALNTQIESKIETIYSKKEFETPSWKKIKEAEKRSVTKKYLEKMSVYFNFEKKYKVIVDCANGPTSKTTPKFLKMLGCDVITINSSLDGFFPGRKPEPTKENLQDLINFVRNSDADLGLAHDGDGDRIYAVDEKGRPAKEDKLLALMGRYSIEKFGKGIVTTVDASRVIEELASEKGGRVFKTEVGDVSVAEKMDKENIAFGGEPSGTWIIGDIHMCPDGTLAAARIIEMIDSYERKLSNLLDSIPEYPISRSKVRCPNEKKSIIMEKFKNKVNSEFSNIANIVDIDGIRLELENGDWILIRPSGTEPYIRITSEAGSESKAKSLVKKTETTLKETKF